MAPKPCVLHFSILSFVSIAVSVSYAQPGPVQGGYPSGTLCPISPLVQVAL